MFWEDLYILELVSDQALITALAQALDVPTNRVLLVDCLEDTVPAVDERVRVLVERRHARGDAALRASIFLRAPKAEQALEARDATLEALVRLAGLLRTSVVAGDESLDPSAWLLIRPSGSIEPITLDSSSDEEDRVMIAARRSAPVA